MLWRVERSWQTICTSNFNLIDLTNSLTDTFKLLHKNSICYKSHVILCYAIIINRYIINYYVFCLIITCHLVLYYIINVLRCYQLNKVKSNNSVMLGRILAFSKNTMFFTFLRGFFLRCEMIAPTKMCKFCVKCTVLESNRQRNHTRLCENWRSNTIMAPANLAPGIIFPLCVECVLFYTTRSIRVRVCMGKTLEIQGVLEILTAIFRGYFGNPIHAWICCVNWDL